MATGDLIFRHFVPCWLVAGMLYWFLLSRLVRRSPKIWLHLLCAAIFGFFLSPGLLFGEGGVSPFPAGAAIVYSSSHYVMDHVVFDGPLWLVTSALFAAISLPYRPRAGAGARHNR